MLQTVTSLELCAMAALQRAEGQRQCGHVLLLLGEDNTLEDGDEDHDDEEAGEELRERLETDLGCCGKMPDLTIDQTTEVREVANWLYAADLGNSTYDEAPANAVHPKRRLAFLHNIHHANEELQANLTNCLQYNSLYGVGEKTLQCTTVIATCLDSRLTDLRHSLRERFLFSVRLNSKTQYQEKLSFHIVGMLKGDPLTTAEKIFDPTDGVFIATLPYRYLLSCIARCREHPDVGVMPPSHHLVPSAVAAVKIYAATRTPPRDFVTPEDIRAVLPHLLTHRTQLIPALDLQDSVPSLAPPSRRKKDHPWSQRIYEDYTHGVCLSLDERRRKTPFSASVGNSAWGLVTRLIAKIPVPQ